MENTTTARDPDDCPKFPKGRDPFGAAEQSQQRGGELILAIKTQTRGDTTSWTG